MRNKFYKNKRSKKQQQKTDFLIQIHHTVENKFIRDKNIRVQKKKILI